VSGIVEANAEAGKRPTAQSITGKSARRFIVRSFSCEG
jgi:hypothetical protein